MLGISRCCDFRVFFLLILILYLLVLLGILSGWGLCVVLLSDFFLGFYPWLLCVFYVQECKEWILYSFKGGGFWSGGIVGVCWFVVDIYDVLAIWMSKNGSSFELCSINGVVGCVIH